MAQVLGEMPTMDMDNEIDGAAPYAPVDNVLAVIRRIRERGLPENLSTQELVRLGIPDGNATRTLRALRFLGLIDNDGRRMPIFERLGRASTNEYPELLGEILREAYSDIFQIVDPSEATAIQLDDAFRHYEPQAQRQRMVRLFTGLCREAGLIAGGPLEPRLRTRRAPVSRTSSGSPTRNHNQASTAAPSGTAENSVSRGTTVTPAGSRGLIVDASVAAPGGLGEGYFLLEGLLRQLPGNRQWTMERRDQWMKAFAAMLDWMVEVIQPSGGNREEEESEPMNTGSLSQ